MRAIGVLLVLVTTAAADPPAKAPRPPGPSKVVEVEPWKPPPRATTKSPGINGAAASGIVIDPGPQADARPWPYGAMIRPPDVGDHNVLVPGSDGLPDSDALSARLARGFDLGLGRAFEWLLTPKFVPRKN